MDSIPHLVPSLALVLALTGPALAAPPTHDTGGAIREEMAWNWAPTEGPHDIRVAPIMVLGRLPVLEPTGFLGEDLILTESDLRRTRNAQIALLPSQLGAILPGALAATLGDEWNAHLRGARFLPWSRGLIRSHMDGRRGLDDALARAARSFPGEAVLFQWMSDVVARPLCEHAAPSTATRVADRLVFVDRLSDPIWIQTSIGVAIVSTDGEVILRHEESYESVLSRASSVDRVAREMARAVAADIAPLLSDGFLVSEGPG